MTWLNLFTIMCFKLFLDMRWFIPSQCVAHQEGVIPRNRSDRRRNNSTVVNNEMESRTSNVATAKIVGLICSRMPDHICRGIVRCSKPAKNKTATISSNEVTNANSDPEITPGRIKGIITLRQVVIKSAPKLAEARISDSSNPTSVAVTVIMTKGIPSAVCASINPG